MTENAPNQQTVMARVAISLLVALIVAGAIIYGVSSDVRGRLWQDLLDRPGGVMTFRFILQPLMAAIAAARDAVSDARAGRPPYSWAVLTSPTGRGDRLWEGMRATARIILLGLVMDTIYQLSAFHTFYPAEAAVIAVTLAFLPYLILRGPIERVARWWM